MSLSKHTASPFVLSLSKHAPQRAQYLTRKPFVLSLSKHVLHGQSGAACPHATMRSSRLNTFSNART